MDHDRFDGLTRSLGAAASRRGLGRALAGGGLGALVGSAVGALDADAKKKQRKKKRKKNTQQGCTPNCTDRTCGNDGCGGSCGACGTNQVCSGGSCLVPACGAGGPCRVFLSSILYRGNLGGLNGADAKCQDLANAAGLPGSYKAWLSDSTSSPSSRFVPSTGPYRLVNGTTIAANFTDLTDGTLLAPINVTETGGGIGSSDRAFTHTLSNGNAGPNLDAHCANWSSNEGGAEGDDGSVTNIDSGWAYAGVGDCAKFYHLYCFQQR